ncbi:DUF4397 domain-containing protein [Chitinophaga vietnamensis]|uniref:DUF4397 domain-containing protein n=1 Tax=Chitinophaga vietnamensis TaxID=2593957 RepID=UPI0011773C2C|nr:DUF4397 domain-containing protein [Chitinophaga vietnamensis]
MLTKKNRAWAIVALFAGILGLSSCLKNDTNITPSRPQYWVWILNASTNGVNLDFYDNDTKITSNNPINFNFQSRWYGFGGNHTYLFTAAGKKDSVVTQTTYNFDSTSYYTYLIYDEPAKGVVVYNDLTSAQNNKINFRFFNLSKDAGPVDVFIGTQKVDSNRTFAAGYFPTSFVQLPDNLGQTDVITIKVAGKDSVLATNNNLSSLPGRMLQVGNVYTAYLAGSKSSTGATKLVTGVFPSWQGTY